MGRCLKHHDVRGADRAGSKNDLTAATGTAQLTTLSPTHPRGALSVQFKSLDEAARFEAKVGPVQHGLQKAARRRPASTALLIDVEITDAVVIASVGVLDGRNSVLVCRF